MMSGTVEKKAAAPAAPILDPKPVKLARPKEPNGQLADVIPEAPTAGAGEVPRLIDGNERAPSGLKRFAIRCTEPLKPKRYVLARSREEAEAHYRRYAALDQQELVVVVLKD